MLAARRDYWPTRFVIPSGLRLYLSSLRPDLRSTFLTPVRTADGDIKLMKPQSLNPALMAVRCAFPPSGSTFTEGKVYHATLATPRPSDRDQYLTVRDNYGTWHDLSSGRFEPCNPKRRQLFRHLTPKPQAAVRNQPMTETSE
jgi:hypothetical protein